MIIFSIENGHLEYFLYSISNFPHPKELFIPPSILKHYVASPKEIIEYIYYANPYTLSALESYIRDKLNVTTISHRSLQGKHIS